MWSNCEATTATVHYLALYTHINLLSSQSLAMMQINVLCLNKMLPQWAGCCVGRLNVYRQRFCEHFFILGLEFGVQMVCLLDFSFILAVTYRRVTCQYLSRAKKNQLNWRLVVLLLESGKSSGKWYIPALTKGRPHGISEILISRRWWNQIEIWRHHPFVQPMAAPIDSP